MDGCAVWYAHRRASVRRELYEVLMDNEPVSATPDPPAEVVCSHHTITDHILVGIRTSLLSL